MANKKAEPSTLVNFVVTLKLKERFDAALEANGQRFSEVLRAHMAEYAAKHENKK